MTAVRTDGTCIRCGENFGSHHDGCCANCGVHMDRSIRKVRRRKIGGKRGRNSGKVGTAKNK